MKNFIKNSQNVLIKKIKEKFFFFNFYVFIILFAISTYIYAANPMRVYLTIENSATSFKKNDIIKLAVSVESNKIINGLSATIEFNPDIVEIIRQGEEYMENCYLFESHTNERVFLITALADSSSVNISTIILGREASGVRPNGKLGYLYFKVKSDKNLVNTGILKELLTNESINSQAMNNNIPQNADSEITCIPIDYTNDAGSVFNIKFGIFNLTGLRVYPNPFIPNDGIADNGDYGSGVIFDNCTEDAVLEIYTLNGLKINSIGYTNELYKRRWYGNNRANQIVSSGIYLYKVISAGERKAGKLVIIR